jgi:MerR family transcriptional regulator, light-induced transcriptional regulator
LYLGCGKLAKESMDRANLKSMADVGLRYLNDLSAKSAAVPQSKDGAIDTARLLKNVALQAIPKVAQKRLSSSVGLPTRTRLAPPISARDVKKLCKATLADSFDEAQELMLALLSQGVTVESIAVDLIGPTSKALGEQWMSDDIGFAEVTIACGMLARLTHRLHDFSLLKSEQTQSNPLVLLAGLNGSQHSLGLSIAQVLMVERGFRTELQTAISESALLHRVSENWLDAVAISLGTEESVPAARRCIKQIRFMSKNKNIVVIAAGNVFERFPQLACEVDADLVGSDGIALIAQLSALLNTRVLKA